MQGVSNKIQAFFAMRSNLSLFFAGALATLALPPLNILPFIFLSLALLAHQFATAATLKQAFARGWWWGAGYFIFGWYWISFALLVDWPKFAWLLPLSILALPCAMAIYIGLCGTAIHLIARKFVQKKLAAILIFPICFTAFEILRGYLFTGFPWNIIGGTLTEYAWLFQGAAVVGVYGLGFLMTLATALWLASYEITSPFWKFICRAKPFSIFIVLAIFGFWRMHQIETTTPLQVRIVQPNTSEEGRWDMPRRIQIMQNLLDLTRAPAAVAPKFVVWPEAATPFIIASEPNVRAAIAHVLPRGAMLITGSIRRDTQTGQMYNSMEYITAHGEIAGHYDKSHLVPFGEYMPFAKYIHMPAVAEFFGDMGHGDGAVTQTIGGVRMSPLICYEAIFPGAVTPDKPARPQMLVNVTEDGWYGKTTGPHQHLAQARARAVEEGIPLVRAANTGISAVVDRFGRIQNAMPYGTQGVMDAEVQLPSGANPPPAAGGGFYKYLFGLMGIYLAWIIGLMRQM